MTGVREAERRVRAGRGCVETAGALGAGLERVIVSSPCVEVELAAGHGHIDEHDYTGAEQGCQGWRGDCLNQDSQDWATAGMDSCPVSGTRQAFAGIRRERGGGFGCHAAPLQPRHVLKMPPMVRVSITSTSKLTSRSGMYYGLRAQPVQGCARDNHGPYSAELVRGEREQEGGSECLYGTWCWWAWRPLRP